MEDLGANRRSRVVVLIHNHSQQAAVALLTTYEDCSTARRKTAYTFGGYFARCIECSKSELFDLPNTYPFYLS